MTGMIRVKQGRVSVILGHAAAKGAKPAKCNGPDMNSSCMSKAWKLFFSMLSCFPRRCKSVASPFSDCFCATCSILRKRSEFIVAN